MSVADKWSTWGLLGLILMNQNHGHAFVFWMWAVFVAGCCVLSVVAGRIKQSERKRR